MADERSFFLERAGSSPAPVQVSSSITRRMADAFVPPPAPEIVRRRWGVITAYGTDAQGGLVDVNIGGTIVTNLQRDANYSPSIGDRVYIDVVGSDLVVAGTTAPSTQNPNPTRVNRRTGTVTSHSVTNKTVNVELGPSNTVTLPYVSSYFPTVGDQVQIDQVGDTNVMLVLGSTGAEVRKPTGDIEVTIRKTAKPSTLLMDGSAVSRTTYAALWAWVQLNGLVASGLFTTGNGSTTFGLPNMAGRVPVGAGTLGSDTYALGATVGNARITLAENQMPAHDHNVSISGHAAHGHTISVSDHGSHGHSASSSTDGQGNHVHDENIKSSAAEAPGRSLVTINQPTSDFLDRVMVSLGASSNGEYISAAAGNHGHNVSTSVNGSTLSGHNPSIGSTTLAAHTVSEATVGGTTQVDTRQPSLAVNWLIWV